MDQHFLSIGFIFGIGWFWIALWAQCSRVAGKFSGPELYQDRRLPLEPQLLELLSLPLTFRPSHHSGANETKPQVNLDQNCWEQSPVHKAGGHPAGYILIPATHHSGAGKAACLSC